MLNKLSTYINRDELRQPAYISWPAFCLFFIIALLPIVLMVAGSFNVDGGFSLYHYRTLFSDGRVLTLLLRSCLMAMGATLLALFFGIPFALALVKAGRNGRNFLLAASLIPLFIPPHIHALAWLYLIGDKGILQLFLMNITGSTHPVINIFCPVGVSIILFLAYFPIFVVAMVTGLSLVDSRLEDAADLHATSARVLRTITLPLIYPYIISGAVFVFIFSFFNYGVPSMLRVPSYPVELFARFSSFYDEAGATALSLPLVIIALILLCLQKNMQSRSFVTIDGSSHLKDANDKPAGRLQLGCAFGFLAITVLLPLSALIMQAGSFKSFQLALSSSYPEIGISLIVSIIGASLATVLAYCLSQFIEDTSSPCKDWLNILALLPFAFPATLFGLGMIYLWNRPVTDIVYGGLGILVISCIARFIPFGIQLILANMKQVSPSMIEAAILCEPSSLKRLFFIQLPLIKKGLAACWLIIFIFSMGELGATLLVIPPGAGTLSLKIYTLMHYGAGPLVAALALLLITANLLVSSGVLIFTRQSRI